MCVLRVGRADGPPSPLERAAPPAALDIWSSRGATRAWSQPIALFGRVHEEDGEETNLEQLAFARVSRPRRAFVGTFPMEKSWRTVGHFRADADARKKRVSGVHAET